MGGSETVVFDLENGAPSPDSLAGLPWGNTQPRGPYFWGNRPGNDSDKSNRGWSLR
jgi:hypothetical protein